MSFTIAHLTDVHLGPLPRPQLAELRLKRVMGYVNWKRARERLSDMAALARLVADMHAQTPDHVAVTGDLVNIALPSEFRLRGEMDADARQRPRTSRLRPAITTLTCAKR